MEECEITKDGGETIEIINFKPIRIKQNEIEYDLNIEPQENFIIFSLNDKEQFPSIIYSRKMSLKEIKSLNKVLSSKNTPYGIYNYLKLLSGNNKIIIKKNNNEIALILIIEENSKPKEIKIELFQRKKDVDSSIKEIYQELIKMRERLKETDNIKSENKKLKDEIDNLNSKTDKIINENKNLKNANEANNIEISSLKNDIIKLTSEIDALKNENKKYKVKIEEQNKIINNMNITLNNFFINKYESIILKEDERKIIFKEIENKMNKKIKNIKKLYQATIDGGDPINFHYKCDNILNTLVFIESEGHKRFGGFTPIPWKSDEKGKFIKDPDKKTFIFSLDNKKIYHLKNTEQAVYHDKNNGPCFGNGYDIGIEGNPIEENNLYTYQGSYDYKGDKHSLSEFENYDKENIKALEFEVFQVLF